MLWYQKDTINYLDTISKCLHIYTYDFKEEIITFLHFEKYIFEFSKKIHFFLLIFNLYSHFYFNEITNYFIHWIEVKYWISWLFSIIYWYSTVHNNHGNTYTPGATYSKKSTILYLSNLQFHPDGCSSCLPVYLLNESEGGSWTVVSCIIISIIKITQIEKNKKGACLFEPMFGFMNTE